MEPPLKRRKAGKVRGGKFFVISVPEISYQNGSVESKEDRQSMQNDQIEIENEGRKRKLGDGLRRPSLRIMEKTTDNSDNSSFDQSKSSFSNACETGTITKTGAPRSIKTAKKRTRVNEPVEKAQKPVDGIREEELAEKAPSGLILQLNDLDEDEKVSLKMTEFQIYNKAGNLLSLDEFDANRPKPGAKPKVYICGKVVSYDPDQKGSVEVVDIEILGAPWIYPGSAVDNVTIGVSSELYDIYLISPHSAYESRYQKYFEKCQIAKLIISIFEEGVRNNEDVTFEALTEKLANPPNGFRPIETEELVEHGHFIVAHVRDYDGARDDDEPSYLHHSCFKRLAKLGSIDIPELSPVKESKNAKKNSVRRKSSKAVKAKSDNVTPTIAATILVAEVFQEKEQNKSCDSSDDEDESDDDDGENGCNGKDANKEKAKCVVEGAERKATLIAEGVIECNGLQYVPGDGVYLANNLIELDYQREPEAEEPSNPKDKKYDKIKYPELWRKSVSRGKEIPKPFYVGRILEILESQRGLEIKIRLFYRPEDTSLDKATAKTKDWNLLYYSDEVVTVSADDIMGRCAVLAENMIGNGRKELNDYINGGTHRFYYSEAFDANTPMFSEKSSIDSDDEVAFCRIDDILVSTTDPNVETRLKTMDIFAGCGGLSFGLEKVAESCWAIETNEVAAKSYQMNHPNAKVFNEDCNELLLKKLAGKKSELPDKGEVDLLVGGPPCQGFSCLNRFPNSQGSQRKNALVVTFMSYVDYYRPRYVIFENVEAFFSHRNGLMLQSCLECFKRMGYSVNHQILNAGDFGLPQSRSRGFIIAAKMGEVLPNFPTPVHAYPNRRVKISMGAPFRAVTVEDSIGDLIHIKNCGVSKYDQEPKTHFQRLRRKNSDKLLDHIVPQLSELHQERISRIPKVPGASWMDLPNIEVTTASGVVIKKLRYINHPNKDVCPCRAEERKGKGSSASKAGKWSKCSYDGDYQQKNTLIPWCLVHTGHRHGNWRSLYGRLDNDGFFATTVTSPDPLGKQGKVLHPSQDRIFSVREAARSQGFPDDYIFCGEVADRYKQIGNAVPPPLAAAIGRELARALVQKV